MPKVVMVLRLPEVPPYRNLLAKTGPVLERLSLGVYFATEEGAVARMLDHRR